MTKPVIVKIKSEDAKPFIRQYNIWSNSTVADPEMANTCIWCGVEVKGVVRAVLGLQAIDDNEVFVWGMFGDGSATIDECIAGVYLMTVVNELPHKLQGAILPTNVDQIRRAEKNGWHKTDTQVMCGISGQLQDLWERPARPREDN
jgi:hypothetical protein